MNQQRLRAYITLIQELLACPSGEEWILLRQNEALVTPELVQVMEQVATQLANQGNLKEAKFLHNLAGQIHHLFVAQKVQHPKDEDYSQAYLELIQALLNCPKGSEGELLAANQELIGPDLVQMMQQVAAQLATSGDQETADYLQQWATELNQLWLQQHDFQPIQKQDAASNPLKAPVAPPTPIEEPSLQPAAASQPDRPIPAEEDFWAEPSENGTQSNGRPMSPAIRTTVGPPQPLSNQEVTAATPVANLAIYEQINHHLDTIAQALTQISEAMTHSTQPPPDPLRYMEVLEHAYAGNWILTSAEIQALIGVQPTCTKGSESFQRGGWIFVKAGKVGAQTGWRVKKEHDNEA